MPGRRLNPHRSRRPCQAKRWLGLAATLLTAPALAGAASIASAPASPHGALAAASSPLAWVALGLFTLACVLVAFEEALGLRKSIPVMLAASAIWGLIAWAARGDPAHAERVTAAFSTTFLDFSELFFFLVASMAFVEALVERGVFDVLRAALVRRGWGHRALFWSTGLLAYVLSSVLNNLTTALAVATVALALGAGNKRFVSLCCINIVVAANAGGAWSAFGDVTTLMVWQAGHAGFFEFFDLFIPALVNWLLPAAIMSLALPAGRPPAGDASAMLKPGGLAVGVLFAATIAATVASVQWLGLPSVYGMLCGLAALQWQGFLVARRHPDETIGGGYDIFRILARAEWDTLLFFCGVLLSVGGLAALGWMELLSHQLYGRFGATTANVALGVASALVDNVPIMSAVLQMNPAMDHQQWLLIALTAGVGGSLLSIGSAAGVALMGVARGQYTFLSHLRWSWAIALGYAASVALHLWLAATPTAVP